MLYRASLTPGVLATEVDDAYWNLVALALREMIRNCVLASLWDGRLEKELAAQLASLETKQADHIRALFNRLHDLRRIIKTGRRLQSCPKTDGEWLDEAQALPARDALLAVLSRAETINSHPKARDDAACVAVEEIGLNARWNSRVNDQATTRTSDEIVPLLERLIRYSRRPWLVDYMLEKRLKEGRSTDSLKRFTENIRRLLKLWAGNGLRRNEFVLHTGNPGYADRGELESWVLRWRGRLQDVLPKDDSVVAIKFWKPGREREFHSNRYLISEVGCIKVGKGFDYWQGRNKRPETLHFLEADAAREVENDLRRCGPPEQFSLRE